MDAIASFEAKLLVAWPSESWKDVTLLVAVSGGADSVALLRGLLRVQASGAGGITAAHLHHGLRGAEADADQQFVVDLCQRLGIACRVGSACGATLAAGRDGLEAAARQARYEFLRSAAEEAGTRYVVTAHTADDQAETILHRILRGTGVAGLEGIARTRSLGPAATVLRPLLEVRHARWSRNIWLRSARLIALTARIRPLATHAIGSVRNCCHWSLSGSIPT